MVINQQSDNQLLQSQSISNQSEIQLTMSHSFIQQAIIY